MANTYNYYEAVAEDVKEWIEDQIEAIQGDIYKASKDRTDFVIVIN